MIRHCGNRKKNILSTFLLELGILKNIPPASFKGGFQKIHFWPYLFIVQAEMQNRTIPPLKGVGGCKINCSGIIKIALFVVLISTLFTSCVEEVDFEFPDAENLPVLNSVFSPEKAITVKLSNTFPACDYDPLRYIYIEDAKVDIYKNGNYLVTLKHVYEGKYTSTIIPEINAEYKIVAKTPNYEEFWATSKVPKPAQISIDTLYLSVKDRKEFLTVVINIEDLPKGNFYYLKVNTDPEYFNSKYSTYTKFKYWLNNNITGEWHSTDMQIPTTLVFSDEKFTGENQKITVYCSPVHRSIEDLNLIFRLHTISEDLYQYMKSVNNQNHVSESNLADLTVAYNNIKNGLGIFAGFSTSTDSVFFKGVPDSSFLFYGNIEYKGDKFGISDFTYIPGGQGEFKLRIGKNSYQVNSNTGKIESFGISIHLNLFSLIENQIVTGKYAFKAEGENFNIKTAKAYVNDDSNKILPSEFEIISGEMNITDWKHDSNINKYVVDCSFQFSLKNGEVLSGNFKGPIDEI